MLKHSFPVFLLLFLFQATISAQEHSYVFQHLTVKDGLAMDQANCIFQDSKGYYWVGTENGLQRFDGKYFGPVLQENRYGINLLPPSLITNPLLEDKEGNIWGQSSNRRINIYHPVTGDFEIIEIKDDTINTHFSNIVNFCKDDDDNFWILTFQNIYKYDYHSRNAIFWAHLFDRTDGPHWPKIIYDSLKKSLWVVREHEVIMINIVNKKISAPFTHSANLQNERLSESPAALFLDSKQNIWFSEWEGAVHKYNTNNFQTNLYQIPLRNNDSKTILRTVVYCFEEDDAGKIWMGSKEQGYYYYDEKKELILPLPVNNTISYSLHQEQKINDLFKDNEGNMLACTEKGISVLTHTSSQFVTVDENNLLNPFPEGAVKMVFQTNNGDILVGTWGSGWLIYDEYFHLKKHFYNPDPPTYWRQYKKNMVNSFAEDHKGKIWISYLNGLLGIYDPVTEQIEFKDAPELTHEMIRTMACDKFGNMWLGSHSGLLWKWDAMEHTYKGFKNSNHLAETNSTPITDILITPQNEIWISTLGNGIYQFDPEREKVVASFPVTNPDSTYDVVYFLTQINDSIIGLSTFAHGVLLFNEHQHSFTSFTMKDGLPSNHISGMAADSQNNLWLEGFSGLVRMNMTTQKLALFDEDDGLLAKTFDANIETLRDGRMVLPTTTGFVYFSPESVSNTQAPPDVLITGFKIFTKSILIDSALSCTIIDLAHSQNFITISYASLSLSGKNTTQYFYKLDDVNEDWVNAGTERFASYTNLGPGQYTFMVRCANRNGIFSKEITNLRFHIHPPWWLTWWSFCLYGFAVLSAFYWLYQNHFRQLENKQVAQIKAMVATQEQERKRISRDLHDDVGTKLSALKLFLSALGEKALASNDDEIKSLAQTSEQFISEAMQDVRQLLLNLSPTVLEEFGYTIAVEGLVHKINETKQIQFNLVVFGMNTRFQKDYELALYRITQELINNVLKHAEAKQVSLQIGLRDQKIILMIEDDGKGFDINTHKDGYGLHNLNARTKLMHGIMIIDSHPGKGTSVLIEIPYLVIGS